MEHSNSNPDRSSGTTDSVQHTDQTRPRGTDGGTSRDDGELSPAEVAHLLDQSSDDVAQTGTEINRRSDALSGQGRDLAAQFRDEPAALDRDELDALVSEVIEAVADVERLASDLHALLTAAEEARARLDLDG
jgi:hypothetical protein